MPPSSDRYIDGSRIVHERSGLGTGSTVYQTEDGRCWVSPVRCDQADSNTTGGMIRRIETRKPAK